MNIAAALGLAVLMAGPFAKPMTAAPQVSRSAAEAEAGRQLEFLLESREREQARLRAVAEKLLRANAELCPETRPRLGFQVATADLYRGKLREAAVRKWGLSDEVRVVGLTPESAAKAAGLAPGDIIVAIDGQSVATGKKALERWLKQFDAALAKDPATVRLSVRRDEALQELVVTPARECAYDVLLDWDSAELNAYADGRRIVITRGIARLAATDAELALVVAHELAHNAKRHTQAKGRNAAVGALGGAALDLLVFATLGVNTEGALTRAGNDFGAGLYSPEFEAEADYVGMYFLARAGFPTDGVETFWRRMAAEHPEGIFMRGSHPPTPERYLGISAAREEIAGKSGGGLPLRPNEKAK